MLARTGRLRRNRKKSAASTTATSLFAIVFSVCLLLLFLFYGKVCALEASLERLANMVQPPFSLLVTMTFTTSDFKEQFLRDIAPVAAYVHEKELDTIAYEVLVSDQNPFQVMVLERYKNKDNAYLAVHKSSAPFLAFRPKLKAMQDAGHVAVSGHSYLDAQIGFGDRCT